MSKKALNIIAEIKKLLSENYSDFKGIYFFGSRSKTVSSIDSDYDIAIIFDRKIDREFKYEIIDLVYGVDLKYDVILDVKVYCEGDIRNPITPFRRNIKNEGVLFGV